jgi:uncharacterized protein involved in exopolysaccharide biosynthesis
MFHLLEKRVSTVEERLTRTEERLVGGGESFAENRKEIRELRAQVTEMREIVVELVGRDGDGGVVSALIQSVAAVKTAIDHLNIEVASLVPAVQQLVEIKPKVESNSRLLWRLGVIVVLTGAAVGTVLNFLK